MLSWPSLLAVAILCSAVALALCEVNISAFDSDPLDPDELVSQTAPAAAAAAAAGCASSETANLVGPSTFAHPSPPPRSSTIKRPAFPPLPPALPDSIVVAELSRLASVAVWNYAPVMALTLFLGFVITATAGLLALTGLFGRRATSAIASTLAYWRGLAFFSLGGAYDKSPVFQEPQQIRRRVHVYSLSLILYLWNRPHYRSGTFQQDTAKNLRNVCFPGTGIPLSWIALARPVMVLALFLGAPLLALVYAVVLTGRAGLPAILEKYEQLLLEPEEWFFYWRLNCRLASYHAYLTKAQGFCMEDKWTFLVEAERLGVPISPVMKVPALIVKDRNEEGGMGIHLFRNAEAGGRWIIQQALTNDESIAKWLPEHAPLSTMRVITSSDGAMHVATDKGLPDSDADRLSDVRVLSCVFRAGREGAATDHSSILFDVDQRSGRIGNGTTNAHWYRLGLHRHLLQYQPAPQCTEHPDSGATLTNESFENMDDIKRLCREAHARLLPDVPLAGWDVALTREAGRCLLEVNLSCNFFNGSFDRDLYFNWMHELLASLDQRRRQLNQ